MMQSMVALGIIGVQWVLVGYSLAFGESQGGIIGFQLEVPGPWRRHAVGRVPRHVDPDLRPLHIPGHVRHHHPPPSSPEPSPERIRFGPYCLFLLLWSTLVYDPLAHWVWAVASQGGRRPPPPSPSGWLGKMGALDFAGGTVVHVAAGFSSLAAILVLKKAPWLSRTRDAPQRHGVDAGRGGAAVVRGGFGSSTAAALWGRTGLAGAGPDDVAGWRRRRRRLSWMAAGVGASRQARRPLGTGVGPWWRGLGRHHPPRRVYVSPASALIIGLIAGCVCYGAVYAKSIFKYDDSLDAFGIHGVGRLFFGGNVDGRVRLVGVCGTTPRATPPAQGHGDGQGCLAGRSARASSSPQATATVTGGGVSGFVITFVLVKVIDVVWGFSASAESEAEGLDVSEHGEVGFDLGGAEHRGRSLRRRCTSRAPATVPRNGQERFTVVVEGGVIAGADVGVGRKLCQVGGANRRRRRSGRSIRT